ncbi:hypothetical protein YC2023_118171 [Brassica napus]
MTRLVQWGKQYNDDDDVQFYGVREECILLLSCKHMCLCKECERKLSYCLLCQSSKFLGMDRDLYTTCACIGRDNVDSPSLLLSVSLNFITTFSHIDDEMEWKNVI